MFFQIAPLSSPLLTLSFSSSSYSIVHCCWCEDIDKRPPFSELVMDIATALEAIAGYMDFSCVSIVDREVEEGHSYDHLAQEDTQIHSNLYLDNNVVIPQLEVHTPVKLYISHVHVWKLHVCFICRALGVVHQIQMCDLLDLHACL